MKFIGSKTFPGLIEEITRSFEGTPDRTWKLVGLLFVTEGDSLVDRDITPHFKYFNKRSGDTTDFFWAGWGETIDDTPGPVGRRHRITFDAERFDDIRRTVEQNTRWKYNGGAQLILFCASKISTGIALDMGAAMCLDLRALKEAGLQMDVAFETIFRFAESYRGSTPMVDLFFSNAKDAFGDAFWTLVKSLVPKEAGQELDKFRHRTLRDITREGMRPLTSLGPLAKRHTFR